MRTILALALSGFLAQGDYLPLKDGARWTYVVEELGAEATEPAREETAEVRGPSTPAGSDWTELRNFLGYAVSYLRVTDEGIEFKINDAPEAPSLTLLKLPVRNADSWKSSLGAEELTFVVRGEDLLEMDDQRLRAVRVEFTASPDKHAGHSPTRGEVWFVEGRGIVQAQVTKDLDCHSAATKRYRLK